MKKYITLVGEAGSQSCIYERVEQSENYQVYSVKYQEFNPETKQFDIGEIVGYDVIKNRSMFPSDEDFGKIAWSYTELENAKNKIRELGDTI